MLRKYILFTVLLLIPGMAFANMDDDKEIKVKEFIQEFPVGKIVYPQDQWELQTTIGLDYTRDQDKNTFRTPISLELGLTDYLQLELESSFLFSSQLTAVKDVEFATLYNFLNNRALELAGSAELSLGFSFLSEEKEFENSFTLEPVLIFYKGLAPVYLNLSVSIEIETPFKSENKPEIGGEVTLSSFIPFGPVTPSLELAAQFENEARRLSIAPGVTFDLGAEFQLGLGANIALTTGERPFQILFILTREWDLEDVKES